MLQYILITGGAGFIGSHLADKLVQKGYHVRILDNMLPQVHGDNNELPDFIKHRVEFVRGDVRNLDDWRKALDGMDAVVHLAAETGTGQSMYEIQRYCDTNIGGTARLLDLLTNEPHTIKKVVVAASRAIYGEGMYECSEHGVVYPLAREDEVMKNGDFLIKCPMCGKNVKLLPTSEDTKIHPTSVYGITKQVQEQLVLTVCKALGISAVTYRYQNVYGPRQSLKNPYTGILSIFSTRIRNNKTINIFEDGEEARDFVYIDDVVEATIAGLENNDVRYESFNVGSGVLTTVNEVVKQLMKSFGKEVPICVTGMYRIGDIRNNYADINKAKELLGYEPKVSFEEGIQKFVAWVQQQEDMADGYEASLEEMRQKGLFR